GMYRFGVAWDGPVQASYNLLWQPGEIAVPEVKPWALFGGIGMVLVALGYTAYALMRKLGWAYLGWGALAWVVTVVVKFAMAIPLNPVIYQSLTGMLPESAALPIFNIYVGLLTGLTEVLITWLVLKNTRLGRVSWSKALAFGIGFGAVEALLLGVSSLANVVLGMTAPDMAPLQALEQIARLNSLWVGAAPVVERFFTVLIHILANVLLFYGVARSDARWFWASFVYKSLVDVVAAFGQSWGIETLAKLWLIEAFVILLGVVAWWGIQQVKQRYPGPAV
ncbi:MAG: YhfC family intramembrane metalloprotease, partial [Anaerolineae bacterium]|nr:YhfC family intramembrane metalloprotease [Anaerolineae bacterium]